MRKWVLSDAFLGMWYGPFTIQARMDGSHFIRLDGKRLTVEKKAFPYDMPKHLKQFGYRPAKKFPTKVWVFKR